MATTLTFGVILAMLFIFGVLAGLGASLTLPGLAGLVLTIGAAVDGNVISFERIREELRAGRGLRVAMKRGFSSSLSAIIDANVTTLLAAGALYQYTTGPVRGFAVTLAVGIVASVLVNTVVVPYVLGLLTAKNSRSYMWHGFDIRGLKFVQRGPYVVAITGLLAVASLLYVVIAGLPMSTDFTGGTNVTLAVPEGTTTTQVREAVAAVGAGFFYCEQCGSTTPQARAMTRYPIPQADAYYETGRIRCTVCGSLAGIYNNTCVRCGQPQGARPQP